MPPSPCPPKNSTYVFIFASFVLVISLIGVFASTIRENKIKERRNVATRQVLEKRLGENLDLKSPSIPSAKASVSRLTKKESVAITQTPEQKVSITPQKLLLQERKIDFIFQLHNHEQKAQTGSTWGIAIFEDRSGKLQEARSLKALNYKMRVFTQKKLSFLRPPSNDKANMSLKEVKLTVKNDRTGETSTFSLKADKSQTALVLRPIRRF